MASPLPQMTQIYALSTSESLSVTDPPTAIGSPTTDLCIDRPELEEHKVIFDTHMRNKPVRHKHVHVLIWTWAEALDDLNVKLEVDQLQEVFENTYGFEVERRELNSLEKAHHELNEYLASFMKRFDNMNTLLIFYYAGHGFHAKDFDTLKFRPHIRQEALRSKQQNGIAWSSSETNIRASNADVLVIFDCCGAGGFGGSEVRNGGPPPFQCLAACGKDSVTLKPGEGSFTNTLIWALKELRQHSPFTSRALLKKIEDSKKLPRDQCPQLLRRDESDVGLIWIAPQKLGQDDPVPTESVYRDPSHGYLDLRFNFYRRVEQQDVIDVAKSLSKLIEGHDCEAKHIMLLDKSSLVENCAMMFKNAVTLKRKRSVSTLEAMSAPRPKRSRSADIHAETAVPQNTFYHLRMALHCSLQGAKSRIGWFADRIRPVTEEDIDPSDID